MDEVKKLRMWESQKASWEAMSRAPLIETKPIVFTHSPYGRAIAECIDIASASPEDLPRVLEQYADPRLVCEVTSADVFSLRRGMEVLGRYVSRQLFEGAEGSNRVTQILAALVLDSLQDYPRAVANVFTHPALHEAVKRLCESTSFEDTSETIQESEKPSTGFRNVLGSMLPSQS